MKSEYPHVCIVAPNAFPLLSGDARVQLIGGAELQMVILARLLAARKWPVSMICLDFGQPDRILVDGVLVIRAYRPQEGIPILRFLWPRLTSIWACMNRANADIYYQQTAGMITGLVAAFCQIKGRKSVFASASNPDLFPNTPRIKYARDRWIYAYGLRHVDKIFVQNHEQEKLCMEHVGRVPEIVPNCYALPSIRRYSSGDLYVLWVSTIRPIKRPELFLDLAQALPTLRFKMIGGPDESEPDLFESVRKRAESLGNVEFLGFLPFEETERHFDDATIFVNTSESEGVPNSFLQAWARGVPTVSYIDAGATLSGREVGIRVTSAVEMIQEVNRLASNDQLREEAGARGRIYVENVHSPEKVIALYERLFVDLSNARTSQR
jgi:glycosyltransferase involved in cell wall biosynthesis